MDYAIPLAIMAMIFLGLFDFFYKIAIVKAFNF